ncbi:uncharacterized protein [Onthophagus taurus]|uniref:uncharacterized protein n=1 Tax=Onthophagus taurus TaxID=166361 RepID=UPI000C20E6D2|nr:uncharacterized protein LOC111413614 [Onthophagus taurus]
MVKPKYCFVPNCYNSSTEFPQKIFITVPYDSNVRAKWYAAVNSKQALNSSKHVFSCEDHFDLEKDAANWVYFKMMGSKLILKKDVLPNKKIEGKYFGSQLTDSAKKRKRENLEECSFRKRLFVSKDIDEPQPSTCSAPVQLPSTPELRCEMSESSLDNAHLIKSSFMYTPSKTAIISSPSGEFYEEEVKVKCDASTNTYLETSNKKIQINLKGQQRSIGCNTKQLKPINIKHPLKRTISWTATSSSTDASISEYMPHASSSSTSSTNVSYKKAPQKQTNLNLTVSNIESNSRFYLGLPQDEYFLIRLTCEISPITYTDVLITIKKIRLNDPYMRLAIDFGMSVSLVNKSFIRSLPILASNYQELIYWPNASKIKLRLPVPFRYRYRQVQSIIDCLEIEIEKPGKPIHQALTWSQYKKCNTLKYLISSTPNGLVNFISNGFGGRTTDKEIVEMSNYLQALPYNCGVMADRGFKHIDELLVQKKCLLIRPPSVSAGKKSTREEVLESKRIAALRIHIERVIRRLREFSILSPHACVKSKLVQWLDYIIIIACGIINLQGSLIK